MKLHFSIKNLEHKCAAKDCSCAAVVHVSGSKKYDSGYFCKDHSPKIEQVLYDH